MLSWIFASADHIARFSGMRHLAWIATLALLSACIPEQSHPEPTVFLPSLVPQIAAHPNPAPASMPADCAMRADFVLDTTSPPMVPVTPAEVEQRTNPLGDRP